MRIAIGGILHETSTFVARPTTLSDFESDRGLFRGAEMIETLTGGNVCTGGFIEGAKRHGFEPVPLLWTFAFPSGLIDRGDYEALKSEFLDRLRKADAEARIDGALLDLHGAMVIDGIDDGDGDLIEAVRDTLGPDRPIIVTQDLHGNHTPRRVAAADAIIGFDTYPHVDMAERGSEAADLIVRAIRGEIRLVSALRQIPLFWAPPRQVTGHPPMDEVLRRVHEMETRPGILSVTISTGFPWADVPEVGTSVIVVTDGDPDLAKRTADELGDWVWDNRERWRAPLVSVRDAIAEGEKQGRFPILLADHSDNTGGGAPGDSTEVLHAFLDLNLTDALLLYLVDPDVAQQAHQAGVGATIDVRLGGKSDPRQGAPVEGKAEVVALSDGHFAYDGPMYAGMKGKMGPSAWLRFGGVSVVVVTAREQPFDQAFARSLGIDCPSMRYIAVKSAAHFRSGFEAIAGSIFNIDAQAIHSQDFAKLPYRKRTRPFFPVEITE